MSTTGKRKAIVIPAAYVYRRAGVNYVQLADGDEIVVQPGEDARRTRTVEILSGLADGDMVVAP